jgi:Flp pilus assembly protein TadG
MLPRTGRVGARRAVAAVELALLSPLLVALLLGIWEVGRLIQVNQILSNAAREGGRQASTGLRTNAEVEQVVRDYVGNAGLPTGNVTVTVTNLTDSSRDAKVAVQKDRLEVRVSLPVQDIRWVALPFVTNASSTLSATSVWLSLRDQDYPSDLTPPAGF